MEELISVIVPVYNVEAYLNDCIDSLVRQTHEMLEIILVDDGSTDNSGKLCDMYAANDVRIHVIHQENQGLSGARNTGIDIAHGVYIGFVDSDDFIAPHMYERMLNTLITTGADIAICDCHKFSDGDACPEAEPGKVRLLSSRVALGESFGPQGAIYNYAWNKLYDRNIIDNIRFPLNKKNEDAFVAFRFLHRANLIAVLSDRLYYYRVRSGSITTNDCYPLNRDIYEVVEARLKLFEAEGWTDLAQKSKKEMLDWHIHRFTMSWNSPYRNRNAWRQHIAYYRAYYNRYKSDVHGIKYVFFAVSPEIYALIRNIKNIVIR